MVKIIRNTDKDKAGARFKSYRNQIDSWREKISYPFINLFARIKNLKPNLACSTRQEQPDHPEMEDQDLMRKC